MTRADTEEDDVSRLRIFIERCCHSEALKQGSDIMSTEASAAPFIVLATRFSEAFQRHSEKLATGSED